MSSSAQVLEILGPESFCESVLEEAVTVERRGHDASGLDAHIATKKTFREAAMRFGVEFERFEGGKDRFAPVRFRQCRP